MPESSNETNGSSILLPPSEIERRVAKVGRRRFIAVIGGTCTGLGAAILGYSRYAGLFNGPPVARIDYVVSQYVPIAGLECKTTARTLKYIAPNSGEEIIFISDSRHPDEVPLICTLLIDGKLVAASDMMASGPIYSTKLAATSPGTEHRIRIDVKEKERLVTLLSKSTDPDDAYPPLVRELLGMSTQLSYEWLVDGSEVSINRDYSGRLSAGQHQIVLNVSDGIKHNVAETAVTLKTQSSSVEEELQVDPEHIPNYLDRGTLIPMKGMNYKVDRPLDAGEIEESLNVIRHELGCNSVKIVGGYEELMILAAEFAFGDGFEEVILNPRYEMVSPRNQSLHISEHISRIIAFSRRANELDRRHGGIVLCVGDELTHSVRGIAEATTYRERVEENIRVGWENQAPKENTYLKEIVEGVRANFEGRITYASSQGMWKYINWRDLGFDIIAPHLYFAKEWYTENELLESISQLKSLGKPVYISEFGTASYSGASRWGGDAWRHYENQTYSQDEQAQNIVESVNLYVRARVDGVFPWCWLEKTADDAKSYGIVKYNYNRPASRKLAFYAYRSYVL